MTDQTILDYIYRIAGHSYPSLEIAREDVNTTVQGAILAYTYKQIRDAVLANQFTQARLHAILVDADVQRQRLLQALKI